MGSSSVCVYIEEKRGQKLSPNTNLNPNLNYSNIYKLEMAKYLLLKQTLFNLPWTLTRA